MPGDAGQHIGQPGLRVYIVHLERLDIVRQGGKCCVHAGSESRTRLPWYCFQQLVAVTRRLILNLQSGGKP